MVHFAYKLAIEVRFYIAIAPAARLFWRVLFSTALLFTFDTRE